MCQNRVNSWKAEMLIMSEAIEGFSSIERAETRRVSPNNNPSHERPTLDKTCLNEYTTSMGQNKSWTREEDNFLVENYEKMGSGWCGEQLHRSATGVRHRASRLNLRRNGPGRRSRVLIKNGYIWISEEGNQYALHRALYEATHNIGLDSEDIIHHIDGNSFNNDPANLQLLNKGSHMKVHPKQRTPNGKFTSDDIVRTGGNSTTRNEG